MNINQKKQLEKRINRLSNSKESQSKSFSSILMLILLLVGSISLLAFQYVKKSEPVLSISADKMNTLYIGVENPITVAVEGIDNKTIKMTSDNIELRPNGYGQYIAIPTKLGEVSIQVTAENMSQSIVFRVLEIPTPQPLIYGKHKEAGVNNIVTSEEMRQMEGLKTQLELQEEYNFACIITSFEITKVPKGEARITLSNEGSLFEGQVKTLVEGAKSGDIYYVDKIAAKCPRSKKNRHLSGLVFKMK